MFVTCMNIFILFSHSRGHQRNHSWGSPNQEILLLRWKLEKTIPERTQENQRCWGDISWKFTVSIINALSSIITRGFNRFKAHTTGSFTCLINKERKKKLKAAFFFFLLVPCCLSSIILIAPVRHFLYIYIFSYFLLVSISANQNATTIIMLLLLLLLLWKPSDSYSTQWKLLTDKICLRVRYCCG